MEDKALELVEHFITETGLHPQGTSLTNCIDFAIVILTMEKDSKMSKPTVRNCQRYAEGKVPKQHRISHGTFYNDMILNSMMKWYIANNNLGKDVKDDPETVKNLAEKVRTRDKQIKALITQQQSFDSVSAALRKAAENAVRNNVLFDRALSVLKSLGKDYEVDRFVAKEDILTLTDNKLKEWLGNEVNNDILEQGKEEKAGEE